jgi:uncharacterized protein (TIGR02266 family)
MTQDTRKDRRVKIVSLNVRYKSATVDEFIENHAHDVSRGGIYIKTANPFAAGTLLKFEIRLASDQAVITGVGRVVWKRDGLQGSQSSGERPSGMGVKFIKVDEPSKAVIDKLVSTKSDAGRAFESEPDATLPRAAGAQGRPGTQPPPRPAPGLTPSVMPSRKATNAGLGAVNPTSATPPALPVNPRPPSIPPPGPPRPSSLVPRPGPVGGMFPNRRANSDPPGEGQTIIRQAAELLEEALREAGGSMEEVGHNPLFSPAGGFANAPPVSPLAGEIAPAKARPSSPPAARSEDAPISRSPVAAMSSGKVALPERASAPGRDTDALTGPSSVRASVAMAVAPAVVAKKKKAEPGKWLLFAAVVATAGTVVIYRTQIFGAGIAAEPAAPSAAAQPVVSSPPPPATTAVAALPEASTAHETAVADAGPSGSVALGAKAPEASATASAAPVLHPAWHPPAGGQARPRPVTVTTAPPPDEPTATTAPTVTPTATEPALTATASAPLMPAPPVTPRPMATASATTEPSATTAPTPTEAPSGKPRGGSRVPDDNPY